VYLEISNTGNVALIAKDGTMDPQCLTAWDTLVQKNAKNSNGDLGYLTYVSNLRVFAQLLADYNLIKTCLLKLFLLLFGAGVRLNADDELIQWLRLKGYAIATTGNVAYATSIEAAMHASDSITTQLIMRRNKLLVKTKETETNQPVYIEDVIANANFALGYNAIDVNVTLIMYLAQQKVIKAKNEARQKTNNVKK